MRKSYFAVAAKPGYDCVSMVMLQGCLRQLAAKADDTEMALGSDILCAALEGYAIAKAFGKGSGLDALKETMAARFTGRHATAKRPPGGASC